MTTTTFDTLAYARKLESVGFSREQAETQAEALKNIMENQVATKQDLRETELRLQKEIKDTELRLLKWQWGIALALAAIMAKGFGWVGF